MNRGQIDDINRQLNDIRGQEPKATPVHVCPYPALKQDQIKIGMQVMIPGRDYNRRPITVKHIGRRVPHNNLPHLFVCHIKPYATSVKGKVVYLPPRMIVFRTADFGYELLEDIELSSKNNFSKNYYRVLMDKQYRPYTFFNK